MDNKNQLAIGENKLTFLKCLEKHFNNVILLISYLSKKNIFDEVKCIELYKLYLKYDNKDDFLKLLCEHLASHNPKYKTLVQYHNMKDIIKKKSFIGYILVLFKMGDYNTIKKMMSHYFDTLKYNIYIKYHKNAFRNTKLYIKSESFRSNIIDNICNEYSLNIIMNPFKYFDIIFRVFFLDELKLDNKPSILNCDLCIKNTDSDDYKVCGRCLYEKVLDGRNKIQDKFLDKISINGLNWYYINSPQNLCVRYLNFAPKIKLPNAIANLYAKEKKEAEEEAEAKEKKYNESWQQATIDSNKIILGESFNEVYNITCNLCCEKTCKCILH